jgi:hypothetical protein
MRVPRTGISHHLSGAENRKRMLFQLAAACLAEAF